MANQIYTYKKAKAAMRDVLGDLLILAGDDVGPSNASWQDVAGTAAVNLRHLATLLDWARAGQSEPFTCFPSPRELICEEDSRDA